MANTYFMETEHDCGLAALSFATGIDYNLMKEEWSFPNTNDIRDDLRDNPGAHFRVLDKLDISYRKVSVSDILDSRGIYTSDKILMLLHSEKSPYLMQHWVVLHRVTEYYVYYHDGMNGVKKIRKDKMRTMIESGWPECVYEIRQPKNGNNTLWKMWDWILTLFLH